MRAPVLSAAGWSSVIVSAAEVLADWCEQECGCLVYREQVLPAAADGHPEARMDIIVYSPQVSGGMYVDFTVASALSREALSKGAALRDGVAAALAEQDKVNKYPNCAVVAFAVEDHGRWGEAARKFVRMVAPTDSNMRSAAISRLHQSLAATLQRVAADAVIAASVVRK